MNYKHLSKYHYIYRVTFGGDYKAHVEKLPIAYSNRHYIFVIVPGDDDLHKAVLNPVGFESQNVFDLVDEQIEEKLKKNIVLKYSNKNSCFYSNIDTFFLIDDCTLLKEMADRLSKLDLQRTYLCELKKSHERTLRDAEARVKKEKAELENIIARIEKLERS